jgi:hypothetical protein
MSQIGTGLLLKSAPKFTDYIVVDGTWKEKDSTQIHRTDDGDSAVANYATWRPGVDASCDLVIKAGETALVIGNVLAEASPGTRSFVVMDAETTDFGGKPLKQSVQLAYHTGFTPTVVT